MCGGTNNGEWSGKMINWDRVNELRDEIGPDDFQEVAEMFLEEVEEVISRLKSSPNPETYEEDMHFLKGSALNLGFADFSDLCQIGEKAAADGRAKTVCLEQIFATYDTSKSVFNNGDQGNKAA
jgi:HPt (histidine-containing phosphotransfer) domain-containing protein